MNRESQNPRLWRATIRGRSRVLSGAVALLACQVWWAVPLSAQVKTVPRYEVFEVVLESSTTYANPFLDVTVTASFTSPSGRELTAYGFHDGGNIWLVRIAPDEPGSWSYSTVASDAANRGLHRQRGSFRCAASSSKGFIRVDPKWKHYFSFSDGTPFFAVGDTCSVTAPVLSDANRKAYLRARAGKPFNFLRIFSTLTFNAWTGQPWSGVPAKAEYWPWGGTPEAPDYDRLNPVYFSRFEKILGELKQHGMYAEIIVLNYYEKPFKEPAVWSSARESLWVRYLVSRLSAYRTVFLWTVAQEYERYPDGKYAYQASDDVWAKMTATLIHDTDPHKHPTNIHPWGRTQSNRSAEELLEEGEIGRRFGNGPEMDVLTHQHDSYQSATWIPAPAPGYYDGPALGVEKAVWADRKYGKPIINTEYGYEWLKGHPVNFNRQTHGTDKCRRAAWRLFTAGAAGLAAGFSGTKLAIDRAEVYYDNVKRFSPFEVADMGHAAQLGYLYRFVATRTAFRGMNPAQSLINAPNLCLANPGKEYIVYAPSGGALVIDLSGTSGELAAEWLNPRTGLYQGRVAVQAGGQRTLVAPDKNDWVLHLKKARQDSRMPTLNAVHLHARSLE